MAAPDMGACLSAGWNGLKNNFVTHVVACVLVGVVSGFTSGLLTGPMMVGYMRMVKLEEEGGRAQIGDVFKGFDDFVPALVAVLLSSILVGIGFMFCVIPGLLLVAIVPTAAYLVAAGEKDGIQAIKRAFSAVKAHLLAAFFCTLVLGIVGALGGLLCGVGILLTLPIQFIGSYHLAKQLCAGEPLALP